MLPDFREVRTFLRGFVSLSLSLSLSLLESHISDRGCHALSISTDCPARDAARSLNGNDSRLSAFVRRLLSGLRANSAADRTPDVIDEKFLSMEEPAGQTADRHLRLHMEPSIDSEFQRMGHSIANQPHGLPFRRSWRLGYGLHRQGEDTFRPDNSAEDYYRVETEDVSPAAWGPGRVWKCADSKYLPDKSGDSPYLFSDAATSGTNTRHDRPERFAVLKSSGQCLRHVHGNREESTLDRGG